MRDVLPRFLQSAKDLVLREEPVGRAEHTEYRYLILYEVKQLYKYHIGVSKNMYMVSNLVIVFGYRLNDSARPQQKQRYTLAVAYHATRVARRNRRRPITKGCSPGWAWPLCFLWRRRDEEPEKEEAESQHGKDADVIVGGMGNTLDALAQREVFVAGCIYEGGSFASNAGEGDREDLPRPLVW